MKYYYYNHPESKTTLTAYVISSKRIISNTLETFTMQIKGKNGCVGN